MDNASKKLLTFSHDERDYILNSDFVTTEVGLMLVEKAILKEDLFHAECSEDDYNDFMKFLVDELAYRGFRPEETKLRDLARRFGVTNII